MWDWIRRMNNAIQAGIRAGYETFKEDDYVPVSELGYDTYKARLARYWHFRLYADNTIFSVIEKYVQQHKKARNLYRHIRSIYNPVSRLINLEVSKVYGGNIDYANKFNAGAIPITGASPDLLAAIDQLFIWSNMGATKNRVVRDGATYGDAALKVIDEPENGRVRLEVLDPRKIADVKVDAVGNVKWIRIEYLRWDEKDKKYYLYAEEIDQERFKTFRGDAAFAWYTSALGQPVSEWDNDYGFVPVRLIKHRDAGDVKFGATSFTPSLNKIDELNDLASMTHDGIRKNIAPLWGIAGTFQQQQTKPKSTAEERDDQGFLKFPQGTTFTPLVMPLDIVGAINAIDKQIKEIEKDMPQLTLQSIRDRGGDVSGVTIRNLYGDASDQLIETQGNYDPALVAAIQMAVTIGGIRRYRNFEAFDLGSYDRGDLALTIKERPVFPDEVDKQTKINLVLQAADSPAMTVVMRELGYSDEDILEVKAAAEGREAAAMRGLASAAFGDDTDDMDDADEDTSDGSDTEEETQTPAQVESG